MDPKLLEHPSVYIPHKNWEAFTGETISKRWQELKFWKDFPLSLWWRKTKRLSSIFSSISHLWSINQHQNGQYEQPRNHLRPFAPHLVLQMAKKCYSWLLITTRTSQLSSVFFWCSLYTRSMPTQMPTHAYAIIVVSANPRMIILDWKKKRLATPSLSEKLWGKTSYGPHPHPQKMESPKYHLNAVVCLLVPSIWDIAYNQLQSKGFGFGNCHDVHRWSQRTVCWLYHMIASSPYAAASHLAYVYNYSVCLSRNKEALNIHCVPTPTPLFLVDSKVFLRTSNPPESFFLFLLLETIPPLDSRWEET